jgi:hypothetical protein
MSIANQVFFRVEHMEFSSALHSKVLPTPVAPKNREEP